MDRTSEIILPKTSSPPEFGLFAHAEGLRERTVAGLSSINWDFPNRVGHSAIEGIHPYPAKFVSDFPRNLLSGIALPKGSIVFDPFCGSGTTLVEAQALGLPSLGIDLNPIACLMARVKTSPVPADVASIASSIAQTSKAGKTVAIPPIPNLDHWFRPEVQIALASLTSKIAVSPMSVRDILRLALSSIIVRVSNQDSDTRYAAVEKKDVSTEDVSNAFVQAATKIVSALSARDYKIAPVKIIQADTLQVRASQIKRRVGLVITSPPYPNAYEYWLYHKYRMWWLGFDPLAVKESEIGARAHFFRANPHGPDDFVRQMKKAFELIDAVTVQGAFACFVIGRSKIHGNIVNNATIIRDVANHYGFECILERERVISANRKSFNLSHANIKTETLLVMHKG